jgi:hypothetical protein
MPPGHRVARRLVAGHHEQEQVGEQLDRGQRAPSTAPLATSLTMSSPAAPALLGEIVEVGEHLEARAVERLLRVAVALELGILGRDDLVGPAEQERPVVLGHAQHQRDHRDRDRRGHVLHEVDLFRCAAASITSRVIRRTFGSQPCTARGVKRLLATWRYFAWSGGSMLSRWRDSPRAAAARRSRTPRAAARSAGSWDACSATRCRRAS